VKLSSVKAPRRTDIYNHIRVSRENHVLTVTLARPEKLNSLNAPACRELDQIWNEFTVDPAAWVAIVTGEGRAFCAGHDLADAPKEPMPPSGWAGLAFRDPINKPIIAAVNGHAYGGGFEIALAADIIIIDENAKLALSEPRVGAVALGGGPQRLVRKVPAAVAMGLLLTGRAIDAAAALQWGIVNEIAPHGTTLDVARKWVDEVLACSPLAIRATKLLALEALEGELPFMIKNRSEEILSQIFEWADTKEGIAAFNEKRKPVWRGC
jgi:enoyl-CoA hydratase/carnithine racemase